MSENDRNEFEISGMLADRATIKPIGGGRVVTEFHLRNVRKMKTGCWAAGYKCSVLGDQRDVIHGCTPAQRILLSGRMMAGKYGPFCVGTDVEVGTKEDLVMVNPENDEEYDRNSFAVSGLMCGKASVAMTPNNRALTRFTLQVSRYQGARRFTEVISVSVWGDRMAQMDSMASHKGTRVIIRGPLAANSYGLVAIGEKIEVDTTSQQWRQTKATNFRFKV